jgi:4-hydroxybenzoate polyprenyltransferase
MLYALPDVEFDRSQGLHSIPSAVGVPRAIQIARVLHVVTVWRWPRWGVTGSGGCPVRDGRGVVAALLRTSTRW